MAEVSRSSITPSHSYIPLAPPPSLGTLIEGLFQNTILPLPPSHHTLHPSQVNIQESHAVNQAASAFFRSFEEALFMTNAKHLEEVVHAILPTGQRAVASVSPHIVMHAKRKEGALETRTDGATFAISKKELARGKFKKVFVAEKQTLESASSSLFAKSKKRLEEMTVNEKEAFKKEVLIQWQLRGSAGILELEHAVIYIGKHGRKVGMMMEYCDKGDLGNFLTEGKLSEKVKVFPLVFLDYLEGLAVLEKEKIQNRDIKGDNLYMKSERSGLVRGKIGDFGLATYTEREPISESMPGTPDYFSPSTCKGKLMITLGNERLQEGNALLEESKKIRLSGNIPLSELLEKRAQELIAMGHRLRNEGHQLSNQTKNDLWSFGIVMYEQRKFFPPACIPANIIESLPDEEYLETWLPYLEPQAQERLKEKIHYLKEEVSFLNAQLKFVSDKEIQKKIAGYESEIETLEAAVKENQAAVHILYEKAGAAPNPVHFLINWLSLLPQAALDKCLEQELETNGEISTIQRFNYRFLKANVNDTPTAEELLTQYKALKEDFDSFNAPIKKRDKIKEEVQRQLKDLVSNLTAENIVLFKAEMEKLKSGLTENDTVKLEHLISNLVPGSIPDVPEFEPEFQKQFFDPFSS